MRYKSKLKAEMVVGVSVEQSKDEVAARRSETRGALP